MDLTTRRIPYGRQCIEDDDLAAVTDVLRSDWLTTGPNVPAFEARFAEFVGARHAVAVSNGTAALHAAMNALNIGPGDEVIVPVMTFAATANAVLYQGGTPVFCDVLADSLLIDPADAARRITPRTRAIAPVDYAGQLCDYGALRQIANASSLALVADSCHALGAESEGKRAGSIADLTVFSFHPVKHITTGEGGMITTDDDGFAARMRSFRNHGIDSDHRTRSEAGTWTYGMQHLGFNYRLTDFQSALGMNQLRKLPAWLLRRRAIAARYNRLFEGQPCIRPLATREGTLHAYHLYVVALPDGVRKRVFSTLQAEGIGVNVHYIPVHLHPFYQREFGTHPGQFPVAESAYDRILSLPLFPGMSDADVDFVAERLLAAVAAN